MNLDALRWIDFYIGKPILLLLSILNFPVKFVQKAGKISPKKILLIKFLGLGSLIMSHPAYVAIKKKFPKAEVGVLTFDNNRQMLKMLNIGDNVHLIRQSSMLLFLIDFARLLPKLAFSYDVCIDLEFFARFSQICSFFTFAKQKIGLHLDEIYRGSLLTNKLNYNYHNHTSKTFLQLVNEVGVARKGVFDPECGAINLNASVVLPKITAGNENLVRGKLRAENPDINKNSRLFVINTNALISRLNVWPDEKYIQISRKLLANFSKSFIVFTGAKNEAAGVQRLLDKINDKRCVNFAGKTDLAELVALLNISYAFLSNDSGPAHIASLTNTRTVVLFGPDSPLINGPIGKNIQSITLNLPCSPCINAFNGKKSDCINNLCLKNIPIELVFKKLMGK